MYMLASARMCVQGTCDWCGRSRVAGVRYHSGARACVVLPATQFDALAALTEVVASDLQRQSRTKYAGVAKMGNKWSSKITIDGVTHDLGRFNSDYEVGWVSLMCVYVAWAARCRRG